MEQFLAHTKSSVRGSYYYLGKACMFSLDLSIWWEKTDNQEMPARSFQREKIWYEQGPQQFCSLPVNRSEKDGSSLPLFSWVGWSWMATHSSPWRTVSGHPGDTDLSGPVRASGWQPWALISLWVHLPSPLPSSYQTVSSQPEPYSAPHRVTLGFLTCCCVPN